MTVQIRPALRSDLSTLLTFQQGIVEYERPMDPTIKPETTGYYDIDALLDDQHALVLVAEVHGQSVGCCLGQLREDRAWSIHERVGYIGMVYVDDSARGQGICASMFSELEAWFRQQGVRRTKLEVYAENPSAIKAYEHAGMRPTLIEMCRDLD
ncbi:MAG: ribosomal protein S18 acetylase RimI-like enzyme [Planctomycetota bacterium]|jgi:ribosomal protein S18 acetylase RimI-like enzyme